MAFRTGRNTLLSRIFSPRADKVLFAATKADHIHHTDHDRLDAILRLLVNRAARRTEAAGARVGTVALASVRATRETTVREGRETLRAVAGVPEAGERVGDEIFDGETEAAIFPGELPETASAVFEGAVIPAPCASPASARRNFPSMRRAGWRRCPISVSTAPLNSCSGTVSHEPPATRLPPRRSRSRERLGRRHRRPSRRHRGRRRRRRADGTEASRPLAQHPPVGPVGPLAAGTGPRDPEPHRRALCGGALARLGGAHSCRSSRCWPFWPSSAGNSRASGASRRSRSCATRQSTCWR